MSFALGQPTPSWGTYCQTPWSCQRQRHFSGRLHLQLPRADAAVDLFLAPATIEGVRRVARLGRVAGGLGRVGGTQR